MFDMVVACLVMVRKPLEGIVAAGISNILRRSIMVMPI